MCQSNRSNHELISHLGTLTKHEKSERRKLEARGSKRGQEVWRSACGGSEASTTKERGNLRSGAARQKRARTKQSSPVDTRGSIRKARGICHADLDPALQITFYGCPYDRGDNQVGVRSNPLTAIPLDTTGLKGRCPLVIKVHMII